MSTATQSHAAALGMHAASIAPAAVPAVDSRVQAVLARAATLLREVATLMGLDEIDATQVAHDGLLAVNDRLLSLEPVVSEKLPDGLLISLITDINGLGEEHAPVKILQHAPGMLAAHRAALGMSPEGAWLIHRSIDLDGLDARGLMRELMVTSWLEALLLQSSIH
jgi:hypothetical protein